MTRFFDKKKFAGTHYTRYHWYVRSYVNMYPIVATNTEAHKAEAHKAVGLPSQNTNKEILKQQPDPAYIQVMES